MPWTDRYVYEIFIVNVVGIFGGLPLTGRLVLRRPPPRPSTLPTTSALHSWVARSHCAVHLKGGDAPGLVHPFRHSPLYRSVTLFSTCISILSLPHHELTNIRACLSAPGMISVDGTVAPVSRSQNIGDVCA